MAAMKKAGKRSDTPQLTRDDWLDAAFSAVVEGGFDKARVLMIADTLGVTRGSFYWHFTDHADLISALLARWLEREMALGEQLRSDAHSTADPRDDLEQLLEVALAHAGVDMENIRFELALRGLGRRDAAVARMLAVVDQARLDVFEKKFMQLTGDRTKSTELAVLFYLAIVGSYQAMSRPVNPPEISAYFSRIIATYLIHQQAPASPVTPAAPARRRLGAKTA
jgi:AcrR family transcriptional regulator